MEELQGCVALVPTGIKQDDFYLEVGQHAAGYLYRAGDGSWTVGVMTRLDVGEVGPFAQGLENRDAGVDFARRHLSL